MSKKPGEQSPNRTAYGSSTLNDNSKMMSTITKANKRYDVFVDYEDEI